jgi:diguanylate cyclase
MAILMKSMRRLVRWLAPTPAVVVGDEVRLRQVMRIRSQVPMIYLIASLNVLILMAVCAHNDVEPQYYGWLAGLVVLAVVRTVTWLRSKQSVLAATTVSTLLLRSSVLAAFMLFALGAFTSITFVLGTFSHSTLMPISLAFGSMSIAHCFATVRAMAIAALVFGIVMSATAMLAVGDFDARVLAVSMMTIAVLMIRFVAGQYDQLVTEVQLQREVHQLANTDALTGLPNRRAAVALMAAELSKAKPAFAIALLDLDGFKAINDRLGHLAGDELLQVVAQRLSAGCVAGDVVGRLGGDEFLVVFRNIVQGPSVAERSTTLLAALCQPTQLGAEIVDVHSSLGTSRCPDDGTTAAQLLAAADAALYAVKRARGPRVVADVDDRRRHRGAPG